MGKLITQDEMKQIYQRCLEVTPLIRQRQVMCKQETLEHFLRAKKLSACVFL